MRVLKSSTMMLSGITTLRCVQCDDYSCLLSGAGSELLYDAGSEMLCDVQSFLGLWEQRLFEDVEVC